LSSNSGSIVGSKTVACLVNEHIPLIISPGIMVLLPLGMIEQRQMGWGGVVKFRLKTPIH